MLATRGIVLGRLARQTFRTSGVLARPFTKTAVNNSGSIWSYRTPAPQAPRWARIGAELAGGLMWWWILWHLYHEHEHVTGEFPYPDPSLWTDVELGIPPDDEGLADRIE